MICLALASSAMAQLPQQLPLERPGPRDFILDQANLITDADKIQIRQIADKLLTDKAVPIVVVTINSMADNGGAGLRIETYARLLFDQWEIGPATVNGGSWNYGMLLLVSKGDRKARIELGAGWRHDQDAEAQRIMESQIIPHFKQGDFSGGILAGVAALDRIGRGLQLRPAAQPIPTSTYLWIAGAVALAIFSIVSFARHGSQGWAWIFWGTVLVVVGAILYALMTSRSGGSSSGGGFGGGSFGGRFSDGGGDSDS